MCMIARSSPARRCHHHHDCGHTLAYATGSVLLARRSGGVAVGRGEVVGRVREGALGVSERFHTLAYATGSVGGRS
jgi:hypothetical protein